MKRIREEKGTALLEAAVTMPIILLISVGIFEFGRAYQTQQVLVNASREGARLAVIEGSSDTAVYNRVNDYVKAGGLKALDPGDVDIKRSVAFAGTTASSVAINYKFEFMVLNPVIRLISPTSTTGGPGIMKASTLMRNE